SILPDSKAVFGVSAYGPVGGPSTGHVT
ncbi:uncharacterized protein METZ01_LOCUS514912, partial [marine metagenome]